ncbi:MAG: hypothetical protein GY774_20360 [Planctomycetes bacterium]|nr:hypothetical protein [Planctomycetota bacterium]
MYKEGRDVVRSSCVHPSVKETCSEREKYPNEGLQQGCFSVTIIWLMSAITSANASPPVCRQTEASMFTSADMVVEAEVTKSRRWTEGADTIHLVAKYKVVDVFKGDVEKDFDCD